MAENWEQVECRDLSRAVRRTMRKVKNSNGAVQTSPSGDAGNDELEACIHEVQGVSTRLFQFRGLHCAKIL